MLQFMLSEDYTERNNPLTWLRLFRAVDQGSDCRSAGLFKRKGLELNIGGLADTNHSAWNNCKAALRENNLWSHVLVMCLRYLVSFKPFHASTWWVQQIEILQDYLMSMSPERSLVKQWVHDMIVELGWSSMLHSKEMRQPSGTMAPLSA